MVDESAQIDSINLYFKDWVRLNKKFVDGSVSSYIMLTQAFMAGWVIGRKAALDEQMESLKE